MPFFLILFYYYLSTLLTKNHKSLLKLLIVIRTSFFSRSSYDILQHDHQTSRKIQEIFFVLLQEQWYRTVAFINGVRIVIIHTCIGESDSKLSYRVDYVPFFGKWLRVIFIFTKKEEWNVFTFILTDVFCDVSENPFNFLINNCSKIMGICFNSGMLYGWFIILVAVLHVVFVKIISTLINSYTVCVFCARFIIINLSYTIEIVLILMKYVLDFDITNV